LKKPYSQTAPFLCRPKIKVCLLVIARPFIFPINFVKWKSKPMKNMNYIKYTTVLTVFVGLAISMNSVQSQVIVTDVVPPDDTATINRTIDSGVTVTGSANLIIRFEEVQDPFLSVANTTWDGNAHSYRYSGGTSGSITYAAASGDYFSDFDAQVVVHNSVSSNWAVASNRFIFESSTDGTNFSTFSVSGTFNAGANSGAGYADWYKFDVSTTALDSLTDVSHLRITLDQDTGSSWNQLIASTTMEVTTIPEPSSFALIGLGLGALFLLRRRSCHRL
jgi:hypothetical protein